jgi:ribosomal protein L18
MVNNFTNINKTNNHLSPQIIEYNSRKQTTTSHLKSLNTTVENKQPPPTSNHWIQQKKTNNHLPPQIIEYNSRKQTTTSHLKSLNTTVDHTIC